ncbi:MAG: hypothetical protein BMS9Abin29_2159 [Gemmatimonadota bacterium]|nr:MAG: hypothetical protein BMS9Abin29_2159 [Gemmatimonadota bacterium]
MRNLRSNRVGRALGAALLAGALGACDFITPIEVDPNAVPEATVDQLFTAAQVATWFFGEGGISRLSSIWTQQMTGTDRQFTALDAYIFSEGSASGEFSNLYTGGGLIDIRQAIVAAEAAGRRVYAGILKVHEAYLFGMAASIWGDIPYSEAANPDIETPALDKQADVYAAVQSLLDEAIADLGSGAGSSPGAVDMSFGGSASAWVAVARTLKARYYLHLAEVDGSRYGAALSEARMGISNVAGNWEAIHSTAATENNAWHQFVRDRSGYISAGDYLLPMMRDSNDPRISAFFTTIGGAYIAPSEAGAGTASQLSETGRAAPGASFPLVTCAENNFIIAEALQAAADVAGARDAAKDALSCQEAYYSVDLSAAKTVLDGLTGEALLEEIMDQKYIALFLNIEAWNDYKRTCYPTIVPRTAAGVPARLLYGQAERQTNPNIPEAAQQPLRNANDPSGC